MYLSCTRVNKVLLLLLQISRAVPFSDVTQLPSSCVPKDASLRRHKRHDGGAKETHKIGIHFNKFSVSIM